VTACCGSHTPWLSSTAVHSWCDCMLRLSHTVTSQYSCTQLVWLHAAALIHRDIEKSTAVHRRCRWLPAAAHTPYHRMKYSCTEQVR